LLCIVPPFAFGFYHTGLTFDNPVSTYEITSLVMFPC
jgi:hypothetical protein